MIDTVDVIKKVLGKKQVQDYTYAIMFLLLSSFFSFFVIRPVLRIAVSLSNEAQELKAINAIYETNIRKIVELQAALENIRPKSYLVEAAIPSGPQLQPFITEIRLAAETTPLKIGSIDVGEVTYHDDSKKIKALDLSIKVQGSFAEVSRFIKTLLNQPRLKHITALRMTKDTIQSQELEISLTVESGYY
jgi:Tfp pilus assembly protein PilO